jgi:hypothetical protein
LHTASPRQFSSTTTDALPRVGDLLSLAGIGPLALAGCGGGRGGGSAMSDAVTLTATLTATASVAIAWVDFYAGAALIGTANASPFTIRWNTTSTISGRYAIRAVTTILNDHADSLAVVNAAVTQWPQLRQWQQKARSRSSRAQPQAAAARSRTGCPTQVFDA